jgi:nucleoside-diphosphate-sugar epimerase
MKVLLTGASGFLGAAILRELLGAGMQVRALVRPGREVEAAAERCEGDICDAEVVGRAVQGVDAVVHAAARVETSGTWEAFADVNIRAARRIIRAAHEAGVRRIVHISSLGVYGLAHDGVTITEESPYESETQARGAYSRSKLAADRIALYEAARGAPVVVLRPGLLYGPGKRPPLARQSFTIGGYKLILARPSYTLPLAYTENTALAVVQALHSDGAVGQAFTIVDENVRQNAYVALYRSLSGETWRPLFLPVSAVAMAAWGLERGLRLARRRSPLTYHQVRRATDRAWFDCARAERVLGWRPRVSVREGLRCCFESLHQPSSPAVAAATVGRAA